MVESFRKKYKMMSLRKSRDGLRKPRFIEAACKTGLGEAGLARIEQERVELSA